MTSATHRFVSVVLLIATASVGCSSALRTSRNSEYEDATDRGPRRWSEEWYDIEAQKPVGSRQRKRHGKLWPPYPRPIGEQQQASHRFHAAHYWPWPYVCDDRRYVREVTQLQVMNGWMTATTLYEYHFDEEAQELNHSGQMHLRWILENAMGDRRVAWVQTASDTETSQKRLNSVQVAAANLVGDGNIPPIKLRMTTAYGRPALEIKAIRDAEISTMPEPRINYEPLPTGTGS
jgi:hypothetical protein